MLSVIVGLKEWRITYWGFSLEIKIVQKVTGKGFVPLTWKAGGCYTHSLTWGPGE
jgi:hypothetical protein